MINVIIYFSVLLFTKVNIVYSQEFDVKVKLVTIGDIEVGKTTIIKRFTNQMLDRRYTATIGLDFMVHYDKRPSCDDKTIKIQIWDTAGQERFRTIVDAYFRGLQGIILVYDISNKSSFEALFNSDKVQPWIDFIHSKVAIDIPILLVGNKIDLAKAGKRQVTTDEGQQLADKYGMIFEEISAKDGVNVHPAIGTLIDRIYQDMKAQGRLTQLDTSSRFYNQSFNLDPLEDKPPKKKSSKCFCG